MLANLDGLNDYDGDWTGGSVPAGEQLKTAYKVGTGYLRKLVEATDDEPAPSTVPMASPPAAAPVAAPPAAAPPAAAAPSVGTPAAPTLGAP